MSDTERAPRRFTIPACPEDVQRVRPVDRPGLTFIRLSSGHWSCEQDGPRAPAYAWARLHSMYPSGLEEVPETELDAAKRRLRAAGYPDNLEAAGGFYNTMGKDVTRVMRHVLAEDAA